LPSGWTWWGLRTSVRGIPATRPTSERTIRVALCRLTMLFHDVVTIS
jgi:hypothetical protein